MTRTVVEANVGALVAITSQIPATYDQAGYEQSAVSSSWTTVGSIENFGAHGVMRQVVAFTDLATGTIKKMPGSKDYGTFDIVLADVPLDAGQIIANAASESTAHYSFRITYPDGAIHYVDAIVSKFEFNGGGANDPQRVTLGIAISQKPVQIAAP